MGVLQVVLPVFGLMLAGWLARRTQLLGDRVSEGLSTFVFTIAVPCLLFRTIATAEPTGEWPWDYWAAYFTGALTVWFLAMALTRFVFNRDRVTAVTAGFTAGQSNTVMVGIPLILTAIGEAGRLPIALLISVHLPLMLTLATLQIELARESDASLGSRLATLPKTLATNPILIGIALGAQWRLTGWTLPDIPAQMIEQLGLTAVPCALFATGMALNRFGLAGDLRATLSMTVLRLIVHPALFLVLAIWVLDLPTVFVVAGLLFASCPTGVNAYLFADRYGTGTRIAASTIALSTALAAITVSGWIVVLQMRGLISL